ncbi:MAG: outer membrane beta-barrel protein, partial [Thermoguttaceae bacterium]
MRLLKYFCSPAAILALCCPAAYGADGVYQPSVFAAPEPEVAACSYMTSDDSTPAPCESACGTCNSCSLCLPLFPCACHGEPWTLQSCLTGDSSCYKYGGWVSAGAYGNSDGAPSNGPIGMRNIGDEFTVNQVWGYFERSTNTGGCGWDWGFRGDMVFGVDGPDTQAFGSSPDAWDNPWDSSTNYGTALPQLYAEVAVNDLKVKLGHFYTVHGYEAVPAPANFFTSHSYAFYYGEPFTHTGALAEYSLYDNVTVWGGWVQGWDTAFDNPLESSDFLGGFRAPLMESATFS